VTLSADRGVFSVGGKQVSSSNGASGETDIGTIVRFPKSS
jgi:hypothetical protein